MKFYKYKILGFTLVEMLLVITLISTVSIFFVIRSTDNLQQRLIEHSLAMTIDLKRASLKFFIDNQGVWPGQSDNCSFEAVQTDLRPYLGEFSTNSWGSFPDFSCTAITSRFSENTDSIANDSNTTQVPRSYYPSFVIDQKIPNIEASQKLVKRLPGSEFHENEVGNFTWSTYVSMGILPEEVNYISDVIESDDAYLFIPRNCPDSLTPRVMIVPQELCAPKNSNSLLGFRIQTAVSTENTRLLRINTLGSDGVWYSNIDSCEDPATPQIFKYCS